MTLKPIFKMAPDSYEVVYKQLTWCISSEDIRIVKKNKCIEVTIEVNRSEPKLCALPTRRRRMRISPAS